MQAKAHLVRYTEHQDVNLALSRIPETYRKRVRRIFIENGSRGVRRLGSVLSNSRRDIYIYSHLPPRVSLKGFLYRGRSAEEFGAPKVGQWTPWAIRRFLLYDVVLHELGHLQEINPGKKDWNRRFAAETKAEEFADYWRRTLFGEDDFQHSDLVHFAPSDEELAFLEVWALLDKPQRYEMVMRHLQVSRCQKDVGFLKKLPDEYRSFVERALFSATIFD